MKSTRVIGSLYAIGGYGLAVHELISTGTLVQLWNAGLFFTGIILLAITDIKKGNGL